MLDSLGVVPVSDDYSDLEEKVSRFDRLDSHIKRIFADVAVHAFFHSTLVQCWPVLSPLTFSLISRTVGWVHEHLPR